MRVCSRQQQWLHQLLDALGGTEQCLQIALVVTKSDHDGARDGRLACVRFLCVVYASVAVVCSDDATSSVVERIVASSPRVHLYRTSAVADVGVAAAVLGTIRRIVAVGGGPRPSVHYRVALVGARGCGKSSLTTCLRTGTFVKVP